MSRSKQVGINLDTTDAFRKPRPKTVAPVKEEPKKVELARPDVAARKFERSVWERNPTFRTSGHGFP